jgi:O-antigen/teichoic acid export membrane protein
MSSLPDEGTASVIRGPLGGRVVRGLSWTILETWGQQALNLVTFVVLARLLVPVDFGLVALAAVFVAFAQLVVDQGMGDALIQRPQITRRHANTAFWGAVATGGALTAVGLATADPIAALFDEPRLAPILRVLSLSFMLSGVVSVQVALLRRSLEFRKLAIRTLVATGGGGVVGIVLAFMGFGAWALVGQQLAATVLSAMLLAWLSSWHPGLSAGVAEFRQLFRYGVNVVGSDFLSFVSRNADNLLIGAVLGSGPLGVYVVGYRLLGVSQTLLLNVARRVTFPAFSLLQQDAGRMVNAYFRVTRTAGVVVFPGYTALAIMAPELTIVLFGARWADAGWVAATLFVIGPVLAVQAFSNSMLNAAGYPEVVLRFRLITAVANLVGFALAVRFGIVAVAGAFVLRGYLLLPLNLAWMRRYVGVETRAYLEQLLPPASAALAMGLAMVAIRLLAVDRFEVWMVVVAEGLVGALVYPAVLWRLHPGFMTELRRLGGDFARPERVESVRDIH